MRLQLLPLAAAAILTCMAGSPVLADDGEINNKSMSRTINVPVFDQDIVKNKVSEAGNAITINIHVKITSEESL